MTIRENSTFILYRIFTASENYTGLSDKFTARALPTETAKWVLFFRLRWFFTLALSFAFSLAPLLQFHCVYVYKLIPKSPVLWTQYNLSCKKEYNKDLAKIAATPSESLAPSKEPNSLQFLRSLFEFTAHFVCIFDLFPQKY